MNFTQPLRKNKNVYIIVISIIAVIIAINEISQFWGLVKGLSLIEHLALLVLFVLMVNAAIRLRVWEEKE